MKKALYLILVGFAIGILVAPDKGSETWRKIRDGFDDWKGDALDQLNDVVSQGKELLGKGKDALETSVGDAGKAAKKW